MQRDFFFLRGFRRSGTNWIGGLLNLHPQVNLRGEMHFQSIHNALQKVADMPGYLLHQEPPRSVAEEAMRQLVRSVMMCSIPWKWQARWLGDRTPGPIEPVLLPDCPHFLVARDGRDVLVSLTFQQMSYANVRDESTRILADQIRLFKQDKFHFNNHPHELLTHEEWVRRAARGWSRQLMADLDTIDKFGSGELRGRAMIVRYERAHSDVESCRAEMYQFLGLDPADALPISGDNNTAPGLKREDPAAHFRAGRVGDWQKYFTPDVTAWFEDEAGEALTRLEASAPVDASSRIEITTTSSANRAEETV